MKKPKKNRSKFKFSFSVDWKSKFIDLLIVVIGISVAFQLNNWNESIKTNSREEYFIDSFYKENNENLLMLDSLIKYCNTVKTDIDTLVNVIFRNDYSDERLYHLIFRTIYYPSFHPSSVTLDNIKYSYGFELIEDRVLREQILKTYNSFNLSAFREKLLIEYIVSFVSPFMVKHISWETDMSLFLNVEDKMQFRNILGGLSSIWEVQINTYNEVLEEIKRLDANLTND